MLKLQEYSDNTHCELCNDTKYIEKVDLNGYLYLVRCSCQTTRKIAYNLKESGLMEDFKRMTLDNFKTDKVYRKFMYDKSIEFLTQLDETTEDHYKKSWLIVSGQVGSGKTHICTGVSAQCIMLGKSFQYVRYVSDMPKLAKDLNNFNVDTKKRAEDKLKEIKEADVLYIDDFLKVDLDKLTFNLIWEIIDSRYYNPNLITIISTEKYYSELKRIDAAFASRLYERTQQQRFYIEVGRNDDRNYREELK